MGLHPPGAPPRCPCSLRCCPCGLCSRSRCLRCCPCGCPCLRCCPCGCPCLRCRPCLRLRRCPRLHRLQLWLCPRGLCLSSLKNDQTYATHTTRLHSEKKSDGTRCATSDGNKDFIDNF